MPGIAAPGLCHAQPRLRAKYARDCVFSRGVDPGIATLSPGYALRGTAPDSGVVDESAAMLQLSIVAAKTPAPVARPCAARSRHRRRSPRAARRVATPRIRTG